MANSHTILRVKALGLLLSSLIGWLEWGNSQHSFLFQAEYLAFFNLIQRPADLIHPLLLLPFTGQLMLLMACLSPKPKQWLIIAGMSCLACLLMFVLLIGLLSLKLYILLSVMPFTALSIWVLATRNKGKKALV